MPNKRVAITAESANIALVFGKVGMKRLVGIYDLLLEANEAFSRFTEAVMAHNPNEIWQSHPLQLQRFSASGQTKISCRIEGRDLRFIFEVRSSDEHGAECPEHWIVETEVYGDVPEADGDVVFSRALVETDSPEETAVQLRGAIEELIRVLDEKPPVREMWIPPAVSGA